jgi:hypothetical protein
VFLACPSTVWPIVDLVVLLFAIGAVHACAVIRR